MRSILHQLEELDRKRILVKEPEQLRYEADSFISDNPIIRTAMKVEDSLLRRGIIHVGAEIRMKDALTALRVVGFTDSEVSALMGLSDERVKQMMTTGYLAFRTGGPYDPNTER